MHGFFEKKNILFESFVFFMVLLFQLSELITVISLSRLTIFSSCNPFFVTYRLSFEAAFYFFNFILVFIWIICAWFARVNFLFHLIFSSFLKLIKFFFPFLVQFLDFLIFSTILSFYSIIVITYLCCMLISFRFCYNIFYNFIVLFFILSSLILLIGSKSSFRIWIFLFYPQAFLIEIWYSSKIFTHFKIISHDNLTNHFQTSKKVHFLVNQADHYYYV